MSFLSVEGISRRFPGGNFALKDIRFEIREGETAVLAGRNGSGKTVLMKHLNGLLLPDSGSVTFRGKDTRKNGPWIRRRVGLVFQDADACLVGDTVMEDLLFGPENLGRPREESEQRAGEILSRLDLWKKRHLPPRFLSGGERKKLTIGGLLVMDPELLILDEPFVGLDYPGVREILELILNLQEEGRSLLIISHDLEKILAHAQRLLLMDQGRLAAQGAPEELLGMLEEKGIRRPPGRNVREMTWLTCS